jgi:hypothetical protein
MAFYMNILTQIGVCALTQVNEPMLALLALL